MQRTGELKKLRQALEAEIAGDVRFDLANRAMYSTDASVYQIVPCGVVIPRSSDDVVRTLRICSDHGVSITARGGGTSQAGQAVGAGIQLDFSKYMNRIVEVCPDQNTVRVQPGIVLDELNAFLKTYDLQLPLDLSTSNRATIGGMISNNSSGTRSVIYGKTLDYVLELNVALADGSVVTMCPLDPSAVEQKCGQDDLEGRCYRVTRDLAVENAAEIERRYPKILRRVGGYNLDEFALDRAFNLARLMVGSEGTLGLVTEATLRLVARPGHRVVCVIHFHDMLDALRATPVILQHEPSAIELVDRLVLGATRGKPDYEPLRSFLVGDPGAVLIVEFEGDVAADSSSRIEQLEQDLTARQLGYHTYRALASDAQARIWKLRKAALGLSMSQTGDSKSISFVEDTAVAPERLCDYIARFQGILAEHQVEAGFYAHASVGLLHIRPVVKQSAEGVSKFESIAERISDLVLEFGGALSGEHGDGLVRSPFQRKMFGPQLYDAFCQIKRTFDPLGILNPGKIVDAPALTQNLKFGPQYRTNETETVFDFSDYGGLSRAAEQCGGVGACRKTLSGTMCPSYMATRDERHSTRGRANLLRVAISGQLSKHGFADPAVYDALDLCLECKACKSECPTSVDMPRLKSEFLFQHRRQGGGRLRDYLLANPDRLGAWGSRFAPVSNWVAQSGAARWLADEFVGVDRRRAPPLFARQTFIAWWRHHSRQAHSGAPPQVAIFCDTFTNYYEPRHGIAAVELANALGANVTVPSPVCCGRPLISKGFLKEAALQAALVSRRLLPLADEGMPIVFCEPSCFSAVTDDHPNLLRGEEKEAALRVAEACVTAEQWIDSQLSGRCVEDMQLRSGPSRIVLHDHCHTKALIGSGATLRVLGRVPGSQVQELDSGCCGMAGSFGYEQEHYNISRQIGARVLIPAARSMDRETIIVASGFSCRHQVQHFAGVQALSPVELMASLLPDVKAYES